MSLFLYIWFFLASFISHSAESSAVKGELRLELPKQFSSAQVTFTLQEGVKDIKKRTLARQIETLKNGQRKTFLLNYNAGEIDSKKQYAVNIAVRDSNSEHTVLSKASFPVLVQGQPDYLCIAIKVPPEPIE